METHELFDLLAAEKAVFLDLKRLLEEMLAAARVRETEKITRLSGELAKKSARATELDDEVTEAAKAAAGQLGIELKDFKVSLLDKSGRRVKEIDELRELVRETGGLASKVAGVLTANIGVIEETMKILESLDARAVGYGSTSGPARPSKLLDRKV